MSKSQRLIILGGLLILLCGIVSAMALFGYKMLNQSNTNATQVALLTATAAVEDKTDTDGDGIPDTQEVPLGLNPNNPDTDGDGLSDKEEIDGVTDPLNPDTDGDELSDWEEINRFGTDPLKGDTDGDTLSDGQEIFEMGTSPTNPDTDGDGENDNVDSNPGALPSPTSPGTDSPLRTPTHVLPQESPTPLLTKTSVPSVSAIPEQRQIEVEWPERIRRGRSEFVRLALIIAPSETPTNLTAINPTRTPEPGYQKGIVADVVIENLYTTHNIFAIAELESIGLELDESKELPLSPGQAVAFTWTLPATPEPGEYKVSLSMKLRFEPKEGGNVNETFLWEDVITIKATTVLGLTTSTAQWVGGLGSFLGSVLAFPLAEELIETIIKMIKKRLDKRDEKIKDESEVEDDQGRLGRDLSEPIKILFLAANPKDTTPLRLDEEIRTIDRALRQAEFQDSFEIEQQWAVRVSDLQDHFLRYKPEIVHFSGHGSASSEIILEDAAGESQTVSVHSLGNLFSILKDNIICVVLNACYSEGQAQAIAEHIDCVIGMSTAVGDKAAINFAAAFYRALGYGRDVKTAFDLGVSQIDLAGLDEQDTPKLLTAKDPQKIVFVSED